jgi:hypothetical protein
MSEQPDGIYGIFAQRFDSNGTKLGTEIHVNTCRPYGSFWPYMPPSYDQRFLLSWGPIRPETGEDVFVRLYEESGSPVGGPIQVNDYAQAGQDWESLAMFPNGGFVVAWSSDGQDGSDWGVFARRFDSDGRRLGTEFQVNSRFEGNQFLPAVAAGEDGRFLIAWRGVDSNSQYHIFAQRYNQSGERLGEEFQVDESATPAISRPQVAIEGTGCFVIAWSSGDYESTDAHVFAQRYDEGGRRSGTAFEVSSPSDETHCRRTLRHLCMDGNGNFIVAWSCNDEGSSYAAVVAKIFMRQQPFRRGDVDGDGRINVSDAVCIAWSLFGECSVLPCEKSRDINDDGTFNLADAISLLSYLFVRGPEPAIPFGECGPDPTADELTCVSYPPCE